MLVSRMSFAPLKPTLFLTCLKMIWIHEWHTCEISGSASEITVAKRTVVCEWHFYNLNVGIGAAPSEFKQVDKGQIYSVKRQRSWRFERSPFGRADSLWPLQSKLETQASSVIFLRGDYIWLLSTSLVRYQIFLTDAAPRFPLEMNTFVSISYPSFLFFFSFSRLIQFLSDAFFVHFGLFQFFLNLHSKRKPRGTSWIFHCGWLEVRQATRVLNKHLAMLGGIECFNMFHTS